MDRPTNSLETEDLEVDGETQTQPYLFKSRGQSSPSKFPGLDMHTSIASKHKEFAKSQTDSRLDSGYQSYQTESIEVESVQSLATVSEKAPIQCSDAESDNSGVTETVFNKQVLDLEDNLKHLSVGDEGISSYRSTGSDICFSAESVDYSLENAITRDDTDAIEVDLRVQDTDGDTLVHIATVSGEIILTSALIEIAEDVECLNIQNELFQSPLHLAALTNQSEIAKCLVAKGVDVSLRDKQGNSPLHIACRNGDSDIVKIIVESLGKKESSRRKQLFGLKNCEGLTCLHIACQNKHYNIMGYLFAKGANVNIGDAKSGRTMLHYAVEKKDTETVVLLLTHPEIDVDCVTYKGETPLVLAYWRNYQDIVKRLKTKGAYFGYDLFEELDEEVTS